MNLNYELINLYYVLLCSSPRVGRIYQLDEFIVCINTKNTYQLAN